MSVNIRLRGRFIALLMVVLFLSIACENPISGIFNQDGNLSSPAKTAEPVIIIVEGDEPSESALGPEGQESTSPVSSSQGTSRANPYPIGSRISFPGWDIEVLEFRRGAAALEILNTENWQAPALSAGQEYAAARLFVRCTSMDDSAHSLAGSDVPVTGSSGITYLDNFDGFPAPEFVYEDMFTAETVEGWVDVIIPVSETNLMLVFINPEVEDATARFFALEEGASIPYPAELAGIAPNEVGTELAAPALPGQKVITTTREVTVLNAIRGAEAAAIIEAHSTYYEPPPADMEFLLLQIEARNISKNETPEGFGDLFAVDETGSRLYNDTVYFMKDSPEYPLIKYETFPGTVMRGWEAVYIPSGISPVLLGYFYPDDGDPATRDEYIKRYFSIE